MFLLTSLAFVISFAPQNVFAQNYACVSNVSFDENLDVGPRTFLANSVSDLERYYESDFGLDIFGSYSNLAISNGAVIDGSEHLAIVSPGTVTFMHHVRVASPELSIIAGKDILIKHHSSVSGGRNLFGCPAGVCYSAEKLWDFRR